MIKADNRRNSDYNIESIVSSSELGKNYAVKLNQVKFSIKNKNYYLQKAADKILVIFNTKFKPMGTGT